MWLATWPQARSWTSTTSRSSSRQKADQGCQTQTSASDEMKPDQRRADQTSVERCDLRTRPASGCDQRIRPGTRADGAQLFLFSFLSSSFSGTIRSCVACSHWGDRVSWLRLLAKDCPGFDPLVAHWPQNDAFSRLAPGQNEMLRERANSADNSSSSVVVGVVIRVKILSIK